MKTNDEREDLELSRLFEKLRRAEEAAAPAFRARVAPRALVRRGRRWAVGWAATAALLGLAVAISPRRPRRGPQPTVVASSSVSDWSAPTGFLLETPGKEMLTSVSYDAVAPVTKYRTEQRRQR